MMSRGGTTHDPLERPRMVVIPEGINDPALVTDLRRRYSDWSVAACHSYLSGIAEISRRPTRAVLAGVDTSVHGLEEAVSGLRKAAGDKARFLLCCQPETETAARRLLAAGADDYLLSPLDANELDSALSLVDPECVAPTNGSAKPHSSMIEELKRFSTILKDLDAPGNVLLEQLAQLVMSAVRAQGVSVVVRGTVASAGLPVMEPVFSVPISAGGHISLGLPQDAAYSPETSQRLSSFASLASDLIETSAAHRRYREMAYTDELSGLPNRRYLCKRLDDILDRAAMERLAVTVLLFDVDNFKHFNDKFGHCAGDEVIRTTGKLFRECSREQDIVTRYGGDEFAVVFWDPQGPREAGSKHPDCALRILDRVREALVSQEVPGIDTDCAGRVTISGGLATYPWDGASRQDLLEKADEALRAAKRAGKNRTFVFGQHPDENRAPS